MRAWALAAVFRRLRFGWGFPAVVTVIAVLSCTVLSMLLLMLQNAEQGGVRASLASLGSADSGITFDLVRPSALLGEARPAADRAVAGALGDAATASSTAVAVTDFEAVPAFDSDLQALGYLTAPDDIASRGTLVAGAWPAQTVDGELPIAVPEQAAAAHGLTVRGTFAISTGSGQAVDATVVGIYQPGSGDDFWNMDALQGAGDVRDFPRPGVTYFSPIEAIGPLLTTPDALDAAGVPVRLVSIQYRPDFSNTGTAQLAALSDRLASSDLTVAIDAVAAQVTVTTELPSALAGVTTGLTVSRSTVTIVAILLILLAVAALGQAARLFTAARADDRVLARARGSSAPQQFGVASVEAAAIGVLAAASGPLLAWLLLPLAFPATNAGVSGAEGPATPVWAVSGVLALVFVAVLLAPLVLPSPSAAEAPAQKARQSRTSGVMRSGLDLGIVVVAALLYWQLLHYRSPVRTVGTLSLDPVLVAGPAAVLLAGALLAARVIPVLARLLDRLSRRTNEMLVTLAAWEVARRSRAATAVVLLLTLSVAVGTFSQSYLATWRQSQLDQAELALGAPVVVGAATERDAAGPADRAAELSEGSADSVSPVIRRGGRVAISSSYDGQLPSGPRATVLALTGSGRDLVVRDRMAALGGSAISAGLGAGLGANPTPASGVDLPETASGVSASVTVTLARQLPGVRVDVRGLVEDGNGLLTLLDFGAIDADGAAHRVGAALPATTGRGFAAPARFVGFQGTFSASEDAPSTKTSGTISVGALAALTARAAAPDAPEPSASVADPASAQGFDEQPLDAATPAWQGASNVAFATAPSVETAPGSATLSVAVPDLLTSAGSTFSAIGWQPGIRVPAVVTAPLARALGIDTDAQVGIVVNDVLVAARVTATAPFAPGATGGTLLTEIGPAASATGPPSVIVVDFASLSRALVESGYTGRLVDDWWVDVPTGAGESYAAAHPAAGGSAPTRSIEGLAADLQNGPLRVASPAALQLAVAAGALLAVIGFALHISGALRARRPELANLRAIGVSRRQVVALLAAESALLVGIGIVLGVTLGIALSILVGPLIGVSANGAPPLPQVDIVLPWAETSALVVVVAGAVGIVVASLSALTRTLDPARILRGGS